MVGVQASECDHPTDEALACAEALLCSAELTPFRNAVFSFEFPFEY